MVTLIFITNIFIIFAMLVIGGDLDDISKDVKKIKRKIDKDA